MFNKKTLSALMVGSLSLGISSVATAFDNCTCVSLNGKWGVEVRVTGTGGSLAPVKGWGGHFSSTCSTDGWGGYYAECHLIRSGDRLNVDCYDGYQDSQKHANGFKLELGPVQDSRNRDTLIDVMYSVTRREVKVQATRIATSSFTTETHPYFVESTFPIRESSGFWKTGRFCYQANGALNKRSGRDGSNYVIDVLTRP
jgi:hypothetical protein